MGGGIEWFCEHAGMLRVGRNYRAFGDDYDWGVFLVKTAPDAVLVVGLNKTPPKPSEWRAAIRVVREAGIREYHFVRHLRETFDPHIWQTGA